MKIFAHPRLIGVVDLLAALAVLVVFNGIVVGSSDDTAFLPWIAKFADPSLYAGDPRFDVWPVSYYTFHIFYLRVMSVLFTDVGALVVSVLVSWTLLLLSLRYLAEPLAGRRVPAVLFAVLLAGYFNTHLAGGYYLLSSSFSTHYLSYPPTIFALGCILRGRIGIAGLLLLVATIINPRVGVFGAMAAGVLWIWLQPEPARRRFAIAAGGFTAIACAIVAASAPLASGGLAFEEILRVWVYIRSTWHYAPAAWPAFHFVNIALACLVTVLLWQQCKDKREHAVWGIIAIFLVLILCGLVNAYWMIAPALVLANPFQFGPTALALLYVLIAIVLVRRLAKGLVLSTFLILLVPDLETRLLMLAVTLVLDARQPARPESTSASFRPAVGEWTIIVAQAATVLVALLLISGEWRQQLYRPQLLGLPLLAAAGLLAISLSMKLKRVTAIAIQAGFAVLLFAMELLRANPNPVRSQAAGPLLDLCNHVREHTAKSAVFITPPGMSDFQYYCRRPSFFSFTHLPLVSDKIPEWIARMRMLRIVPADVNFAALNHVVPADFSAYDRMTVEDFHAVAGRDARIAYVLVPSARSLDLPLRYQNADYKLYALDSAPR